jgi:hypothetical protein
MTQLKPSLSLSRLVVSRHGSIVYDQKFHLGVNIIRGTNSHGKSTVADLIFFALGGDMTKWKQEALTCDFVFAEIRANDATLTLKREIRVERMQSLQIFFGDYESAVKSAVQGWMVFPYKRTEQTESFSQALFRALQMPETTGDGSSNITMHQLLRLIYIDQMTTPDSLLRFQEFDSSLTRRTVVDYLFGVYDNFLYQEQLELREAKRQQEIARGQQNQLEAALDKAEIEIDPVKLKAKLEDLQKKLAETDEQLSKSQETQQATRVSQKDESAPIVTALTATKKDIYRLNNELQELGLDIEDSQQFISSLEVRLAALDDANVAREVLGSLPLIFCPQCLSPLQTAHEDGTCSLCKQQLDGETTKQQVARMRQEIALQIKESKAILLSKRQILEKHSTAITRLNEQARIQQAEFERLSKTVQTRRDQKTDKLLVEKGSYERGIQDLLQKMKIVEVLASLLNHGRELAKTIQDLEFSIKRRLDNQKTRYFQALDAIQDRTLYLLKNDLLLEEWFRSARSVTIDPDNNTFSVDGRNQFSASSVTYLKNSIHFGILFASLDLDFFRSPRFLLCDNIEDKGMTTERSQNFQRHIVAMSKAAKVEHQIIFTTSMIDPSLDNAEYCIGPNYKDGHKTLNIKAATVISAPKSH